MIFTQKTVGEMFNVGEGLTVNWYDVEGIAQLGDNKILCLLAHFNNNGCSHLQATVRNKQQLSQNIYTKYFMFNSYLNNQLQLNIDDVEWAQPIDNDKLKSMMNLIFQWAKEFV